MEGGQSEDPKTCSDETGSPPETVSDDATGVGRSYECMFCKRGFSTAQALGGHMNIHRRDRARIGQPPPVAGRVEDDPAPPPFSSPFPTHPTYSATTTAPEILANYHMHHLMPPSSTRHVQQPSREDTPLMRGNPQQLNLFGGDLHLGPGTQAGLVAGLWHREEYKRRDGEEGELDLELRLGYEP